jgi:hypothetical protein
MIVCFRQAELCFRKDDLLFLNDTNRPEERKRMVKAALEENGFKTHLVSQPEEDLSLARCVHSDELLNFLATSWNDWQKLWKEMKGNRGWFVVCFLFVLFFFFLFFVKLYLLFVLLYLSFLFVVPN